MTEGMKSSEFGITVAILVVGLVMVLTNHLEGSTFWGFATVAGGAYSVSRGLAKTEPVKPA